MIPEESPRCIRRPRTYWTTCGCPDCVKERSRTRKIHSTGRAYRVPSDYAWRILAEKIDAGWTALAISSATGLPETLFGDHLARYRKNGDRRYLSPATAAAIANMGRPTLGQVGAEPSRRRLRALAAIGWGLEDIAAEISVGYSTLGMIRNSNERVTAANANAIADVYDRLHMTTGPNTITANLARSKGWQSPLAWDDIESDPTPPPVESAGDWNDQLDEAVVLRVINGNARPRQLTRAEAAEIVRRLLLLGLSANRIENEYGLKVDRYREAVA